MSQKTALTLVQTLTDYAVGLGQDIRSSIADFIAPEAVVGTPIGQYKEYNSKNDFTRYNRGRGTGGPATRIHFDGEDKTFNCKPQALETTIDDSERSPDGGDTALEQSKVRTLVVNNAVSREYDVMAKAKAAITAESGKGKWSNANVDPFDEMDEQIESLITECGLPAGTELRVLWGIKALRIMRGNPNVKKMFPGAAQVKITAQMIADGLLVPAATKVGLLSYDTAELGATKSAANIIGADVWIFLASQMPTNFDPSFMKVFTVRGGSISAVKMYRDDTCRSDVYAVDVSEDIKVTGSACVKRFTIS